LVAAGLARMPYKKFLYYNSVATIPKSLLLLILGFYAGAAYLRFTKYFDEVALFFMLVGLALPVLYIIIPWAFRRLVRIPRYLNSHYENSDL
jgi:membrane-associated protein